MIPTRVPSGEGGIEAELLRNVLDTVAHDLGGLSSALALRVDVMQATAPSASVEAYRAIADELRALGSQLRAFRETRGGDTLSSPRAGSVAQWFSLLSRFAQPLLGRGVALRGNVDDVHVGATAVHELTYIALAMLHAVRERSGSGHAEIRVASERNEHGVTIRLTMGGGNAPSHFAEVAESRWWRWALERAAGARIGVRSEGAQVELHVPVPDGA